MAGFKKFRDSWNAREISAVSRYFDQVLFWPKHSTETRELNSLVQAKAKVELRSEEELENLPLDPEQRHLLVMNGIFNFHLDIQGLLQRVHPFLPRSSRILVVAYNPYLRWAFALATFLGLRQGELPATYLTRTDMRNLAALSGFELTRIRSTCHCPLWLFGLGPILNRVLPVVPVLRWLGFSSVILLRPVKPETSFPSLSVVIPARNEKGNVANAIQRLPRLGKTTEVIFVEGGSSDGTWEEIERVQREGAAGITIRALRQTGKGKCDAVRLGFSQATGDLLTILDADLTMPPELLPRFYEAWREGKGDFINGTRLVYPIEGEEMKFLNRIGNGFFAKALSYVLDVSIGDSLCGTKLFARRDYLRMAEWRKRFGEFDPFGDFELLFPAAVLGLGIRDIPVRYRARTYGNTNISRFRDGWVLLKMTIIGFFRIKMGPG
jgi:hypothetical protein